MKESDKTEINIIVSKSEENTDNKIQINPKLSPDLNNLRLACPHCDLIPALFFDVKSKNIYQVSAACENKHLINNSPVKEFYEKYMKIKDLSKDTLNDFVCPKHNSNYNSFCKSCQKNICKECSDTEHKNHFISQYFELLPSNEDIIQLKNSIDQETNDVEEFLNNTYKKWLEEIQQKYNELIDSIRYKNKLYNFIINFYETKEFNYQNIYNIKIVSQNQLKRNPLTQEIQTLKNLISRNENTINEKNNMNYSKDELKENQNKFLKLKTAQFLKIINLTNSDINSNYKFNPFNNSSNNREQSLESFLDDKKESSDLDEFVVINPYNKSKTLNSTSGSINKNITINKNDNINKLKEEDKIDQKMQFSNEVKLKKKKLEQTIPQESIVHCMALLKDNEGNYTNQFATGLDNGNINVYYFDKKSNKIYLDYEIKEHTKPITYITGLKGGRILTCCQDNTMKIIEETMKYSYLLSFWKRYYVLQTITKPSMDKHNLFQPVCAIEMNINTIVSGDWTHLTIWKLIKKSEKKTKKKIKNFSFDLLDYNKNKYEYYYENYKEINISTSVTSLLNIDNKTFVSAHYGQSIVSFYNIYDESQKTLDKIRCVDSANQCLALIELQKPVNNYSEKIIIVGGYKCIYLLSVKNQSLIDKISLPGNDYIKCVINSGMNYISNGFICAGLFNQSSYNLVHYNANSQLGFSEITVNEISKIRGTGKNAINALLFLKKDTKVDTYNQKNIVLITGGIDKNLYSYSEKLNDDDDEEEEEINEIKEE